MNLHNPAAVPDSLVGPNHRLLSTDDLDKPLPEGAEYWMPASKQWCECAYSESFPTKVDTYRIPLSLSDRLRSERDRLDEQIRVVEAVEKGAEWEIRAPEQSIISRQTWSEPDNPLEWFLSPERECKWQVRLKPTAPTPRSIPWTLETRPETEVWVRYKADTSLELKIDGWCKTGGHVAGGSWHTFRDLHDHWLQRSGEPAGQEVQG